MRFGSVGESVKFASQYSPVFDDQPTKLTSPQLFS